MMLTLADERVAYTCPRLPLADRPDGPGRYDVYVAVGGAVRTRVPGLDAADRDDAAEQAVLRLRSGEFHGWRAEDFSCRVLPALGTTTTTTTPAAPAEA